MECLEPFDEGIYEPEDGTEIELPIPFNAVTQTIRPTEASLKQNPNSSEEDLSRSFDENLQRSSRKSTVVVDEFGFKIDLSSK